MSPVRMARIEEALRTVLDFHEAFNRHDGAGMAKYIGDDCVLDDSDTAPSGTVYRGKESIVRRWESYFAASPDVHRDIEDAFGMGFRCVLRWKSGYLRGVDIFGFSGGLIHEIHSYVKG